ncbi:MAG TPA: hypothetical protein VHZ74_14600 [Bryobacteraceae bacterium]|nr:hypothetical protein [Bryobacteraceae bacterium]
MKTWVLDAGVAAKWHLAGEPLADEAIGMLRQFQTGDIEFLVPDLFLPGFGMFCGRRPDKRASVLPTRSEPSGVWRRTSWPPHPRSRRSAMPSPSPIGATEASMTAYT